MNRTDAVHLFWRFLESPVLANTLGESSIDFYGRLVSPALTARRVLARVEAIRGEARDVKSFVLRANGHFRGFRPGQHLMVTVEIDGVRHTRCYSPSNAPDERRTVVLTVKRHERGLVSRWMHERLRVGDWVELGRAFGEFAPPERAEKLLLVAGGSGITPLASLVRHLCARDAPQDIVLVAYAREYPDLIFADQLRTLARSRNGLCVRFGVTREPPRDGDLGGHFGEAHLDVVAPDAARRRTLACGPPSLLDAVRALWAKRSYPLPPTTETFSPPEMETRPGEEPSTVNVIAERRARRFLATSGASLLVQAERAGLSPANGCRRGICFTCACRKRSGTVRNVVTGAVSSAPDENIRLCISEPLTDLVLDL